MALTKEELDAIVAGVAAQVSPTASAAPAATAGWTGQARAASKGGATRIGKQASAPAKPLTSMTKEELIAHAESLRQGQRTVSLKVSEKGALSVYGFGRFPITLYGEQWVAVLALADDIRAFIKANAGKLATR